MGKLKGRVLGVLLGIVILIAFATWIICCMPSQDVGSAGIPKERKNYIIEKLTPEIIRVIAFGDYVVDGAPGYGPVFAEAIREIGRDYVIEEITAIQYTYKYLRGSYTKELLIRVSPRD